MTDPDLPSDVQRALAEGLTGLAVPVLRKSSARTIVHIDLVPADRYFIDGRPLTGGRDARVEAGITLGTNSAEEKAAFIARAGELLSDLLGPLPRGGVALHELHPESYGYHGGDPVRLLPPDHGRARRHRRRIRVLARASQSVPDSIAAWSSVSEAAAAASASSLPAAMATAPPGASSPIRPLQGRS